MRERVHTYVCERCSHTQTLPEGQTGSWMGLIPPNTDPIYDNPRFGGEYEFCSYTCLALWVEDRYGRPMYAPHARPRVH